MTQTGHSDAVIRPVKSASGAPRTGICIVRLEHQVDDELLISLRMNLDIHELSGEWQEHCSTIDEAVLALQRFAGAFEGGRREGVSTPRSVTAR